MPEPSLVRASVRAAAEGERKPKPEQIRSREEHYRQKAAEQRQRLREGAS